FRAGLGIRDGLMTGVQTSALPSFRTIADLSPVGDELTVEHLDGIRVRHEGGFDVVLGCEASLTAAVEDGLLREVFGLAAASADEIGRASCRERVEMWVGVAHVAEE